MGVVGFLTRRGRLAEGSELFGRALEHFLYMELVAHRRYSGLLYPVSSWRTASGLEVDFVLGDHEVALEVKGTSSAQSHHLRGLTAFGEEYKTKRRLLVTCDPRPRSLPGGMEVLP